MANCHHPSCRTISKGKFCGRHWHDLPEDLRDRIKRCKSTSEKGGLLVEAREYFDERMIGDLEITTCRGRYPDFNGCGANIVWLKTRAGKNMPVEVDGVQNEDEEYDRTRHTPHWATCPYAEDFRKVRSYK